VTEYTPYIDVHTHGQLLEDGAISIVNVFAHRLEDAHNYGCVSVGLHPWHVDDIIDIEECISNMETFCKGNGKVIAIGEIGLDRACGIDFQKQIAVFKKQLLVAQKLDLPVIVHCVRAYPDVIACIKDLKLTIPIILHNFCANNQVVQQLLKYNVYFSLGNRSLGFYSTGTLAVPTERMFLETDDTGLFISDICNRLSLILQMDAVLAKRIIYANYVSVFKASREQDSRLEQPLSSS